MDNILGIKTTDDEDVSNNNNEDSLQASKVSKENNHACKLHNLGTRIPSDTSRRFHRFVFDKYGKINGVFSQEVTKALESWMDKQQQTTSFSFSSSKSGRPRADKIDKLRQIAMQLKQLNSFPDVNPFTIVNTIKNVLGPSDKRTINSYLLTIKKLSKPTIHSSGAAMIDVSKFAEKIQGDDW
jgi:hypothetical protein